LTPPHPEKRNKIPNCIINKELIKNTQQREQGSLSTSEKGEGARN
jgi:hypothetical protein